MQSLPTLVFLTILLNAVLANRETLRQDKLLPTDCKTTITKDKVVLKRAALLSKYIFTGKVHSVNLSDRRKIYKVNIRRVLKGDLNDIGVKVRFDRAKSLRFSDATILVQSSFTIKCPPLRVRTYAIFLTENKQTQSNVRLSLVVQPVPLSLRNLDIIESAVKGVLAQILLQNWEPTSNVSCVFNGVSAVKPKGVLNEL